jgi:hypothetical protein
MDLDLVAVVHDREPHRLIRCLRVDARRDRSFALDELGSLDEESFDPPIVGIPPAFVDDIEVAQMSWPG